MPFMALLLLSAGSNPAYVISQTQAAGVVDVREASMPLSKPFPLIE